MKRPSIIGLASTAVLVLLAVVPASAQGLGAGIPLNQEDAKTPEQIEKQKAIEDAYKATLKKMPDAKQNDPWGNMRTADTPGSARPKTPQAKLKTAPKKTNNAAN